MTNRAAQYDIYGIGNALLDMEYAVDDGFLRDQQLAKGRMTLVDAQRIGALRTELAGRARRRLSGGSAANTVFAVQGFGGRGFYSCRVADDDPGRQFLADLAAAGIGAAGTRSEGATGACLALITPDAERTMTTFLGVSAELSPQDIDENAIAAARHYYMEGYLAASPTGCAAAVLGRELAESAMASTCLSLSDPSMVAHCRDGLTAMLGNGIGHLFCNAEEALAWAGTDRIDIASRELADIAPSVAITLGAKGSLAVHRGTARHAGGYPADAVDTTGAGDIYAGAFLYARTRGAAEVDAARFANFAAAALVSRHGPRLPTLADYAALRARFAP